MRLKNMNKRLVTFAASCALAVSALGAQMTSMGYVTDALLMSVDISETPIDDATRDEAIGQCRHTAFTSALVGAVCAVGGLVLWISFLCMKPQHTGAWGELPLYLLILYTLLHFLVI